MNLCAEQPDAELQHIFHTGPGIAEIKKCLQESGVSVGSYEWMDGDDNVNILGLCWPESGEALTLPCWPVTSQRHPCCLSRTWTHTASLTYPPMYNKYMQT